MVTRGGTRTVGSRRRLAALVALGLVAASASLAEAKPAKSRPQKPRTTESADWASAPAYRTSQLGEVACHAELTRRGVKFRVEPEARGVRSPVRLEGPLAGVTWRTEVGEKDRAASPHEVLDCRLALALEEWSHTLAKHGVVEAHVFSFWRPPPKTWPKDREALRHPGGLAADVRRFVVQGSGAKPGELVVLRDWTPQRGLSACAASTPVRPDTPAAHTLRALFCEADAARTFTSMLSPNYDGAHANHFHVELRPDVRWRLVL